MENISEFSRVPVWTLAFTEKEQEELKRARAMPISFDEDCPETTPERALKFKRVNPVRQTAQ